MNATRDPARWHSPEFVDAWIRKRQGSARHQRRKVAEFGRLIESLPFSRDAELEFLDLGFGWGRIAEPLLGHFTRARIVGLDFSKAMLSRARDECRQWGERVELVELDMTLTGALDGLGRNRFDAVFALQVLHHLPRDRMAAMYGELHAAMRPGAVLLNLDRVQPSPSAAVRVAQRAAGARWSPSRNWTRRDWQRPRPLDRLLARVDRRFGALSPGVEELQREEHLTSLRSAGFDVAWETTPNGPLLFRAVRG